MRSAYQVGDEFTAILEAARALGPHVVTATHGGLCFIATLSYCPGSRPFRLMGHGPTWADALLELEHRSGQSLDYLMRSQ